MTVLQIESCSVAAGPFPPASRRCDWCAAPLAGRARRWCSSDCSNAYGRNHWWTLARDAALARDGCRCCRCGRGYGTAVLLAVLIELAGGDSWAVRFTADAPPAWHRWTSGVALEVNHIEPRRGAGYGSGCHHHLSNLETLCHDCHVAVTGAQRRHGLEGPARLVLPPVIPQPALLEV
jgi:hypothetical protein